MSHSEGLPKPNFVENPAASPSDTDTLIDLRRKTRERVDRWLEVKHLTSPWIGSLIGEVQRTINGQRWLVATCGRDRLGASNHPPVVKEIKKHQLLSVVLDAVLGEVNSFLGVDPVPQVLTYFFAFSEPEFRDPLSRLTLRKHGVTRMETKWILDHHETLRAVNKHYVPAAVSLSHVINTVTLQRASQIQSQKRSLFSAPHSSLFLPSS